MIVVVVVVVEEGFQKVGGGCGISADSGSGPVQ